MLEHFAFTMKNSNLNTIRGIPENDYWRLVTLLGDRTKADNYIESEQRNYRAIVLKIYFLELKHAYKTNRFVKVFLIVLLILVLAFIAQYFLAFDPITL